jgi:hypothetical protein
MVVMIVAVAVVVMVVVNDRPAGTRPGRLPLATHGPQNEADDSHHAPDREQGDALPLLPEVGNRSEGRAGQSCDQCDPSNEPHLRFRPLGPSHIRIPLVVALATSSTR